MAYLEQLASERIRIKDRIELLFNFRILRTRPFDNWDKRMSAFYNLQLHYYDKVLQDKRRSWLPMKKRCDSVTSKALLEELTTSSMLHLKHHLHRHISDDDTFDTTYRKRLDAFLKRYPVIGSSTHSIVNSLGGKAVLDYVIIDEASQQDIVPGVLALSCAKNLIIVGTGSNLHTSRKNSGWKRPRPGMTVRSTAFWTHASVCSATRYR